MSSNPAQRRAASRRLDGALGQYIRAFARLEHIVWLHAGDYLGLMAHQMQQLLLEQALFTKRIDALEDTARQLPEGAEVLTLLLEVRRAAKFRAQLIHGRILRSVDSNGADVLIGQAPYSRKNMEVTEIGPVAIDSRRRELTRLGRDFVNLGRRHPQ